MSKIVMPTSWYNLPGDDPDFRIPTMDPETGKPCTLRDYQRLLPEALAEQELDQRNAFVPIPKEVLAAYMKWRPTPLIRARALEEQLGTKCRLYYKYEGCSAVGSHKPNTAIPQAHYTKLGGYEGIVTETGAGQVGSSVSMASAFYGLRCQVFMVRNSYESKPGRRTLIRSYNAEVHSSPSTRTRYGSSVLKANPDFPGSLGVAISEAIEVAQEGKGFAYNVGSAQNLVCMHQSIIGEELLLQLKQDAIRPDIVVCCIGGGSGFAGLVFPLHRELSGKGVQYVAVESNAVPRVSKGIYAYDYADTGKKTPLSKMYTLGSSYSPPGIHSGGLRYHGLSPLVSKFLNAGLASVRAYSQLDTFKAALAFARCEGILPAPEASHSIKGAIELALEHRTEPLTIVFLVTGHGHFDLAGYEKFAAGTLEDSTVPEQEIARSLRAREQEVGALLQGHGARDAAPRRAGAPSGTFDKWWDTHFREPGRPAEMATRGAPPAPVEPRSAPSADTVDYSSQRILTESLVRSAAEGRAKTIEVGKRCVITPLAREAIGECGLTLTCKE